MPQILMIIETFLERVFLNADPIAFCSVTQICGVVCDWSRKCSGHDGSTRHVLNVLFVGGAGAQGWTANETWNGILWGSRYSQLLECWRLNASCRHMQLLLMWAEGSRAVNQQENPCWGRWCRYFHHNHSVSQGTNEDTLVQATGPSFKWGSSSRVSLHSNS